MVNVHAWRVSQIVIISPVILGLCWSGYCCWRVCRPPMR